LIEIDLKEVDDLFSEIGVCGVDRQWEVIRSLKRILGTQLPKYLLDKYRSSKSWKVRVTCVFYSLQYARNNKYAVELGVLALSDRSKIVRYRACMLLSLSLQTHLLPELRRMLSTAPEETTPDLLATIDAIERQNHNYFFDREHSRKITYDFAGF
jgi:hypothetical protein